DLEGHGRAELFDDVDLSRTVGWFTAVYPVRLDLTGIDRPGEMLKAIKEQLRSVPHRGIGYGVLRYLSGDVDLVAQLQTLPQPQVSFTYLGMMDQVVPRSGPFRLALESSGLPRSPRGRRRYLIEISTLVVDENFHLEW